MQFENILVMYGADDFLEKEQRDRSTFYATVERLKSLRDTDPEAFDEMIEAMLLIQGEKQISYLPHNLYLEYGIADSPVIKAMMEKQARILAIVRSNKETEHLAEAVDHVRRVA